MIDQIIPILAVIVAALITFKLEDREVAKTYMIRLIIAIYIVSSLREMIT